MSERRVLTIELSYRDSTIIMKRCRLTDPVALTWGVLLVSSMLFAAWMLCARGYGKGWVDDIAYSRVFTSDMGYVSAEDTYMFCEGDEISTLSDALGSGYWHYMLQNGRLANFLMLLSNLLPPWLVSLLHGAAYGFMIAGILRLGLGREWSGRPLALAGAVVAVWCFFPWWDMYASSDFMFNYVWGAAACLWSATAIFTPSEQRRLRWLWLVVPASMVHEGLSAMLDVGIVAYVLCNLKTYISDPRRLVLPAAFGLFSFVPLLSPGIWERSSYLSGGELDTYFLSYVVLAKSAFVLAVAAAFVIAGVRARRWVALAVCVSMLVAAYAISIKVSVAGRGLWGAYLVAAVMLCRLCSGVRLGESAVRLGALAVTAALCVWGVQLCRWQWRMSAERDAIVEELRAGHPEGMYSLSPVTDYDRIPWWLFGIPGTVGSMESGNRRLIYADITGREERRIGFIALLPTAPTLEESMESLPPLPSGLRGDKHCIVSAERHPDACFSLTFSPDPEPGAAGWHPVYSLRKFDGPVRCKSICEEAGLRLSNGDSVYVYRPMRIARSLWNHRLIDAEPCSE